MIQLLTTYASISTLIVLKLVNLLCRDLTSLMDYDFDYGFTWNDASSIIAALQDFFRLD